MSKLVDLVETEQAVDFQTAINERLAEKVGNILAECQQYIASRLFEDTEEEQQYDGENNTEDDNSERN